MSSPLSVPATDTVNMVIVRAIGFTGQEVTRELPSGDALVIGCSPACGLRLEGPGIAGLHCTLSLDEEGLTVEDWDTETGTYVNGQRVPSRMVIECGAELKIGDYQVRTEAVGDDPVSSDQPDADPPVAPTEPPLSSSPSLQDLLRPEVTPIFEETPPAEKTYPVAEIQPVAEQPVQRDQLVDDESAWDSPFDDPHVPSEPEQTGYVRDGLGEDAEELLRIEVEFLRTELAQRDARLAELEELAVSTGPVEDDDLPSRDEVETLVGRLEQLLVELEQSDERISTMTELLRVSDEATVASQEELAQMESWIGEVERRVRQWEEEWHAERDVMEKSIVDLTAERDRAESRSGAPDQTELINELRGHAQTLQTQLQQVQAERDDLSKRLAEADVASFEEKVAAAVEAAMREERLQISQAKAEYARERADLAKQREELTNRQTSSFSEPDVADVRIRAFREHLKEIRAAEPSGRPAPSLSQRLGKLWRKIDGKPLDTD